MGLSLPSDLDPLPRTGKPLGVPNHSHVLWPGPCFHWAPGEDLAGAPLHVLCPQAAASPHSCRGTGVVPGASRPQPLNPLVLAIQASPFPVTTGSPGGQSLSSEHTASGMLSFCQERRGACVRAPLQVPSSAGPTTGVGQGSSPAWGHTPFENLFLPERVKVHAPVYTPTPAKGPGGDRTPASGDGESPTPPSPHPCPVLGSSTASQLWHQSKPQHRFPGAGWGSQPGW